MAMAAWMLELDRTAWRLYAEGEHAARPVVAHKFEEPELVSQPAAIREALTAQQYWGEPIVLALESTWCLATTLSVNRPQELRDRRTMLYRLEEWIPWEAEESVADYSTAGKRALVVAVNRSPLAEFIGGLEAAGIPIQSIVPSALLAAAAHMALGDWPDQHVVLFESDGCFDLIFIEGNKPAKWLWLHATTAALTRELEHVALDTGESISCTSYGLSDAARQALQASSFVRLISDPRAEKCRAELGISAAAEILQGRIGAPIELRHSAFGHKRGHVALRKYSVVLQAAAALFLIAMAAILLHRGQAAARRAEMLTGQQVKVFRDLFPNTKVPTGIKSRLESELAKLKGLQGDDVSLPDNSPATTLLHRLLASMPTDRRFRLLEIRIEDGRVYLDGEVRDHSDAEAIAQRLRAQGFEVPAPRTQRLDDKRVSLRITGMLPPTAKLAMRKAT